MDHGDCERQALADAERQCIGRHVDDAFNIESPRHFPDAIGDRVAGHPEQASVQFEVLPDRQFGIEREGL